MVKTYRMKKNVDLKELEKYGYTKWTDSYYKDVENSETIWICKSKIRIVQYNSYDDDGEFEIIEAEYKDEECGYYYEDLGEKYIPDLIKAGLVEKY